MANKIQVGNTLVTVNLNELLSLLQTISNTLYALELRLEDLEKAETTK